MDQELIAYLDRLSQQIEGLRGEMTQQTEGLREENRHTRVIVEGLRSDIQLLAEGVFGNGEKFTVHESATRRELEGMKATIAPYYQDLNVRVTRLEAWADRHGREVLDVIREKYGKREV
jgi:hypothetical protein